MSIYTIWIPGEHGYKEHYDRMKVSTENNRAIKEQTIQYINGLNQQTRSTSNQTAQIIASNQQISSSIHSDLYHLGDIMEQGFNYIGEVNVAGFNQVTSAIEALHSAMAYYFGTLIQRIEYQNDILTNILKCIQAPFETRVREYYNRGILLVNGGILEEAVECFKHSIEMELGKHFYPSYYQLGRLYLSGADNGVNIVNPKIATDYLLEANKYGNGLLRTNPDFKPILADCKFYLSQSYYFQLTGRSPQYELELLNNAIKYCEEAVALNDNLSQGYYHLAKYYSYRLGKYSQYNNENERNNIRVNFILAVNRDRNYLRSVRIDDPLYDRAFEPHKDLMDNLIIHITNTKKEEAKNKIVEAKNYFKKLESKNINQFQNVQKEFQELKNHVLLAENDFNIGTYYGFDDCVIKIDQL